MGESGHLREIRRLDPVADHRRIVYLDACFEFPWDTTRSLELALFRTFASPSIAALLDSTGEFGRAAQKRYDDTDLILSTIVEAGYDSEEGKRAIRQMNRIHGRFEISNEDFLYVLSSFVFEPIRWNARFGWRPLIETEKLATFEYWREVGRRMAIREIPETYEDFERFNEEYERREFRRTEAARRVGHCDPRHVPRLVPRAAAPVRRPGDLRADGRAACSTRSGSRSRREPSAPRSRTGCERAPGSWPRLPAAPPPAPASSAANENVRPRLARRRARPRGAGPDEARPRCTRVSPRCPSLLPDASVAGKSARVCDRIGARP